jgi:nucleoside-diphosphate-sugar epimerase
VQLLDMPSHSGYSGTPLAKKLGVVGGTVVLVKHAPDDYQEWLAPLPPNVTFVARMSARVDVIHLFATERAVLVAALTSYRATLRDDAAVWVSWPKRTSKVPTDITEDVIRAVALPMGFVDIKVCAVSEVWSGLKLVIRKTERGARAGR